MTGEVTLQGRVLPIGGLKQKVLAAHAAGLTDVILPERNRGDLDDVPEDVREQMTFHPVMTIDEVLERCALEPAPQPEARRRLTRRIAALFRPYRGRLAAVLGADRRLGGAGDGLPVPAARRARRRDPGERRRPAGRAGRRA